MQLWCSSVQLGIMSGVQQLASPDAAASAARLAVPTPSGQWQIDDSHVLGQAELASKAVLRTSTAAIIVNSFISDGLIGLCIAASAHGLGSPAAPPA